MSISVSWKVDNRPTVYGNAVDDDVGSLCDVDPLTVVLECVE